MANVNVLPSAFSSTDRWYVGKSLTEAADDLAPPPTDNDPPITWIRHNTVRHLIDEAVPRPPEVTDPRFHTAVKSIIRQIADIPKLPEHTYDRIREVQIAMDPSLASTYDLMADKKGKPEQGYNSGHVRLREELDEASKEREAWIEDAGCKKLKTNDFYFEFDSDTSDSEKLSVVKQSEAAITCGHCAVKAQCMTYAPNALHRMAVNDAKDSGTVTSIVIGNHLFIPGSNQEFRKPIPLE